MKLSDEMKFPYNDPDIFSGLSKQLIIQYQRMNMEWAIRVEKHEGIVDAITRNDKLVPYHLQCWADSIEEQQGWKSNLTEWLRSVADALSAYITE